MVRTKADAATRVAAGGKAPKRALKTSFNISSSPGSDKASKDNLPGNRYFPRETPAWQKKITFFYDKNKENGESNNSPEKTEKKSKKDSPSRDEINKNETSLKRIKSKTKKRIIVSSSEEENESEAMDAE